MKSYQYNLNAISNSNSLPEPEDVSGDNWIIRYRINNKLSAKRIETWGYYTGIQPKEIRSAHRVPPAKLSILLTEEDEFANS